MVPIREHLSHALEGSALPGEQAAEQGNLQRPRQVSARLQDAPGVHHLHRHHPPPARAHLLVLVHQPRAVAQQGDERGPDRGAEGEGQQLAGGVQHLPGAGAERGHVRRRPGRRGTVPDDITADPEIRPGVPLVPAAQLSVLGATRGTEGRAREQPGGTRQVPQRDETNVFVVHLDFTG